MVGGFIWRFLEEKEKVELDLSIMTKIDGYKYYYITKDGKIYNNYYKKYMKSLPNADGYLHIQFRENNVKKDYLVHRLVAQTFIPNPDNKQQQDRQ